MVQAHGKLEEGGDKALAHGMLVLEDGKVRVHGRLEEGGGMALAHGMLVLVEHKELVLVHDIQGQEVHREQEQENKVREEHKVLLELVSRPHQFQHLLRQSE